MSSIFPEKVDAAASLVPINEPVPSGIDELEAAESLLDDTTGIDDLVVIEPEPPPIGRGYDFDFAINRFKTQLQARGPSETHGHDTLRVWIEKTLRTDRGAHPVYPDDYGIRDPYGLVGHPQTDLVASDYEQRVEEALTFHPRITGISDFTSGADPDNEAVQFTFRVILDDDITLPVSVRVP